MAKTIGQHLRKVVMVEIWTVYEGKELARRMSDCLCGIGQMEAITVHKPQYEVRFTMRPIIDASRPGAPAKDGDI